MYEAVMEFLEPQLQIRDEKIRKETREQTRKEITEETIQGTIDILRELGLGNSDIINLIIKKFKLSETEAERLLISDSVQ